MKTLTFILLFWNSYAFAQLTERGFASINASGDSRSIALINNSPALNPALLPGDSSTFVSTGMGNRFGLKELNTYTLYAKKSGGTNGLAIWLARSGFEHYQETSSKILYGLKPTKRLTIGIGLGYAYYRLSESNLVTRQLKSTIGSVYSRGKITFGSLIQTNNKKVSSYAFGLKMKISQPLHTSFEWQIRPGQQSSLHFATLYTITESLHVVYGIRTRPFTNCFGLNYLYGPASASFSIQSQQIPGYSTSISVTYKIKGQ